MNSKITLALACVALAFAAKAEYQQMASKELLEKRITEVNSNVNAMAQKLRSALDRVQTTILSNLNATVKSELPQPYKQNMEVARLQLEGSYFVDPTTPALNLHGCHGDYNCFLAWDKIERNPSCYSNKLTNVYCWLQTSVNGSTTNQSYTLTTPDGALFVGQSQFDPRIGSVILSSSTNAAYKVRLGKIELFQPAWDIILGQ